MSGDDATKQGIAAALDCVGVDPAGPDGGEAEQLPLLPLGDAADGEEARRRQDVEASVGGGGRRGPGRPKGARNMRSRAWIDYLSTRYTSPLEILAQVQSRPVQDLAAELGCSLTDALKLQIDAAKASLPYWHEKQATAVQVEGGDRPVIVLGNIDGMEGAAFDLSDGDRFIIDGEMKDITNQSLSKSADPELDSGELDGDAESE